MAVAQSVEQWCVYPEVGSSSLSPDFSDLLDLADFRYYVPNCSHSYINMIEIP